MSTKQKRKEVRSVISNNALQLKKMTKSEIDNWCRETFDSDYDQINILAEIQKVIGKRAFSNAGRREFFTQKEVVENCKISIHSFKKYIQPLIPVNLILEKDVKVQGINKPLHVLYFPKDLTTELVLNFQTKKSSVNPM